MNNNRQLKLFECCSGS